MALFTALGQASGITGALAKELPGGMLDFLGYLF